MKALLLAFGLFLTAALPAAAQGSDLQNDGPKVLARLVAEQSSVAPGGSVTVALEEKIRPEWHTYWVNPGDAGSATSIAWTLPPGWKAGAIQWPTPKRLPVLSLMDYGYEGTLWLLTTLAVPADAKPGDTITLKAAVSWLVCKNICVPEDAVLSLPVRIGPAAPDPAVAKQFAAARALLPVASPWTLTYARGSSLDLYAAAPALAAAHPVDAAFFPLASGTVKNAAPQTMGFTKDGLVLRLTPGDRPPQGALEGVLVLKSSDGSVQALTVDAAQGPVPDADFAAAPGGLTLLLALAFAFVGGLILNVMPCVLPILAMKAVALAGHAGEHAKAQRESFAYAAGAVLSFLVLGLAIVGLRQAGAAIGWGFQLQEPLVLAGFALLIFAAGLNLSGLFEVGSITAGDSLAQRSGATGAFFTGVLAVAVGAPCTGPFMAPALGFALTQSVSSALLIFLCLGLGFALPFMTLGIWPRALSFLPRPGPWMLRLKQFLAFPMYGSAAFFAWVLAQETGPNGVVILLAAAVAVALAAWLWTVTRDLESRGRWLGLIGALLVLAAGAYGLALMPTAASAAPTVSNAESYTPEKLASLRAAGKPVFVDVTAAWCITCLVNEKAVLSRPDIKSAFANSHVTYLVADWTNRNAAITKLLDANSRPGPPLYLYYAPGAATPVILPQILTEDDVLSVLRG